MSSSILCLVLLLLLFPSVASEADLFNVSSSSSSPFLDLLADDASTATITTAAPGVVEYDSVKLISPGEVDIVLLEGFRNLVFKVVNNTKCFKRVFLCYQAADISPAAKLGCPENYCGFAVDFSKDPVLFMDRWGAARDRDKLQDDEVVMQYPVTDMKKVHDLQSCNPLISKEGYVKILVKEATEDCYFIVKNANIKAETTTSTPTTTTTTTTEAPLPISSQEISVTPSSDADQDATTEMDAASALRFLLGHIVIAVCSTIFIATIVGACIFNYICFTRVDKLEKAKNQAQGNDAAADQPNPNIDDPVSKLLSKEVALPGGPASKPPSKEVKKPEVKAVVEPVKDKPIMYEMPLSPYSFEKQPIFTDAHVRSMLPASHFAMEKYYEEDPVIDSNIDWNSVPQNCTLPNNMWDLFPTMAAQKDVIFDEHGNISFFVVVRDATKPEGAIFQKLANRLAEPVDYEKYEVPDVKRYDKNNKLLPEPDRAVLRATILSHDPPAIEFITDSPIPRPLLEFARCSICLYNNRPKYFNKLADLSLGLRELPLGFHFYCYYGTGEEYKTSGDTKSIYLLKGFMQNFPCFRKYATYQHFNTSWLVARHKVPKRWLKKDEEDKKKGEKKKETKEEKVPTMENSTSLPPDQPPSKDPSVEIKTAPTQSTGDNVEHRN